MNTQVYRKLSVGLVATFVGVALFATGGAIYTVSAQDRDSIGHMELDGVSGESLRDTSDSSGERVRVESRSSGSVEVRCEDGVCTEQITSDSSCSGYQCPDGSCASSREHCGVDTTISPDVYAHDHDERESVADSEAEHAQPNRQPSADRVEAGAHVGGGAGAGDDIAPAQDYNSSRSNRIKSELDDADDGADEDIADGEDIIRPAQDYNSTRSNRRKNTFFNPDEWDEAEDDEDGVVTVLRDRVVLARDRAPDMRCGAEMNARDDGGSLWCWGHGVRAAAVGEADEDGVVATSSRVLQYVSVRGDDIRAWSEAERAQFREYRERVAEAGSPERLTADITNVVLNNNRVADLTITDTEATVRYRAEMRLFGFIPMEREVTASGTDMEDISIDYPWYSFLARKPDTETIRGLFSTLMTSIGSGSGGGAGKATFQDFSS